MHNFRSNRMLCRPNAFSNRNYLPLLLFRRPWAMKGIVIGVIPASNSKLIYIFTSNDAKIVSPNSAQHVAMAFNASPFTFHASERSNRNCA